MRKELLIPLILVLLQISIFQVSSLLKKFIPIDNPFFKFSHIQFIFIGLYFIAMILLKDIDFGWHLTELKTILKSIKLGFSFGLLTIIGFIILNVIFAKEGKSHPAVSNSFWVTIFTVWIMASFSEELFFRGIVQSSLQSFSHIGIDIFSHRFSFPIIFSAIAFALGHFCLWGKMGNIQVIGIVLSCFINGMIAGKLRESSGSIIPAYIVHLMFNITGMGLPTLIKVLTVGH
jgi:membrane protease YdiL (CAAX protease family)